MSPSPDLSRKFSAMGKRIGKAFQKIPKLIDETPECQKDRNSETHVCREERKEGAGCDWDRFETDKSYRAEQVNQFVNTVQTNLAGFLGDKPVQKVTGNEGQIIVGGFLLFCLFGAFISAIVAVGVFIGQLIVFCLLGAAVLFLLFLIGGDPENVQKTFQEAKEKMNLKKNK